MRLNLTKDSDFSLQNIPFGIFSAPGRSPRAGTAIGNWVVDLYKAALKGLFNGVDPKVFSQDTLNDFIGLGKETTSRVRRTIQEALEDEASALHREPDCFVPMAEVTMHLPVRIGDYTDFYSSIEHATNVGKMFRDPDNALLPNWKHLPVAYHGRASSIIVSGAPIYRPKGQIVPKGQDKPVFAPTRLLDFELETAFIVGKDTALGQSVSTAEAEDYIFGMVLFNDWSARDIQKWEYVPLGPFLGKNFGSSISPWIVTLDALEPFRVDGPGQDPPVMDYLRYEGKKSFDIRLEVAIAPEGAAETMVCRSNFRYMYWNMAQQLAHHTVNGCNLRIGDMMGSGTLSGPEESEMGSMLELSWAGSRSIRMADGSERKFILDNDTVIMRGHAGPDGARVGFGEVRTKVLPAK
jgi:fumarylacetoacetase